MPENPHSEYYINSYGHICKDGFVTYEAPDFVEEKLYKEWADRKRVYYKED